MFGTSKTADNLFVRSHTFVKDHDGAGSDVFISHCSRHNYITAGECGVQEGINRDWKFQKR